MTKRSRAVRHELRSYRRHLMHERRQAARYRVLAARADTPHRDVLLDLARAEDRHAEYWESKLTAAGGSGEPRTRRHGRVLAVLARIVGVRRIVPLLERIEAREADRYREDQAAETLLADERVHAALVSGLAPSWRARASGSFRAGVFGINDGLVSNLALVMGMAGGGVARTTVLLAGVAGLVSGAGSMAAGEFISVTSQRELLEGEARVSAASVAPLEGTHVRGLPPLSETAARSEAALGADAEPARPEGPESAAHLESVGSPLVAAASSFGTFAAGAAVPVIPYAFGSGGAALAAAGLLGALALFLVGAGISILTLRPMVLSGLRQLWIGGVTAGGTYLVGATVGHAVG